MTDLTIFKKNMPLPDFTNEECNLVSISSGMTGGVKFIRLDGKQFILVDGGVKTPLNKSHLMGIIVNAGKISKRYYKNKYTGKDTHAPDCSSANGETPDKAIAKPVCDNCETCPKNAWGSKEGYTGKKAKACQEYRRVAFCITDKEGKHQIYRLDVPAGSLNNLRAYGTKLSLAGVPVPAVMTKITFDANAPYQQLAFDACQVFTKEVFEGYMQLGQSADVLDLLTMEASAEVDVDLEETESVIEEPSIAPTKKTVTKAAPASKTIIGGVTTKPKKKKVKKVIEVEVDEDEDEEEDTQQDDDVINVDNLEDLEAELDAVMDEDDD